jgi:hypothetical protein
MAGEEVGQKTCPVGVKFLTREIRRYQGTSINQILTIPNRQPPHNTKIKSTFLLMNTVALSTYTQTVLAYHTA